MSYAKKRVEEGKDIGFLYRAQVETQWRVKVQLLLEDKIVSEETGPYTHRKLAERAFNIIGDLVSGEDMDKVFNRYRQER